MAKALVVQITGDTSGFSSATTRAEDDVRRLEGTTTTSGGKIGGAMSKVEQDATKMQSGTSKAVSGIQKDVMSASSAASGQLGLGGLSSTMGGLASDAGPWGIAIAAGLLEVGTAVTAFTSTASAAEDLGISVSKLERLTGGTAEQMSVFAFAGQQTGVATDSLGKAIRKLSTDMDNGGKGLAEIGVSATNSDGSLRDTYDVLGDVADAFQNMGDGADKTAVATKLFGRSGSDLIPMFEEGKAGLEDYRQEAERFGLVLDQSGVQKAREAKNAQRDMSAAWQGASTSLGQTTLPILTQLTEGFTYSITELEKMPGQIANIPGHIAEFVGQIGPMLGGLKDTVTSNFGPMKDAAIDWIEHAAQEAPGKVAHFFGEVAGGVAREAIELPGQVKDLAPKLWGWIEDAAVQIPGKMGEVAGNVKDALLSLAGNVPGWLGDAGSWLLNTGRDVLTGLWNGISNAIPWLIGQLGNLKDQFLDGFKHAFGISSPSKIMMPLGEFLAQGVGVGYLNGMQQVVAGLPAGAQILDDAGDYMWNHQGAHGNIAEEFDQAHAGGVGAEHVINYRNGGQSIQPIQVNLHLDGQQVATAMVPHLSSSLQAAEYAYR